eukprot:scaffold825_cov249-Pinguiococcus_pyrenoidosus.AAC.62
MAVLTYTQRSLAEATQATSNSQVLNVEQIAAEEQIRVREVADIRQDGRLLRTARSVPLNDAIPDGFQAHRRNQSSAADVELAVVGDVRGIPAEHLTSPDLATGEEHVPSPTVVRTGAVARESPRELGGAHEDHAVPQTLAFHLFLEAPERTVQLDELSGQHLPVVRVGVEATQLDVVRVALRSELPADRQEPRHLLQLGAEAAGGTKVLGELRRFQRVLQNLRTAQGALQAVRPGSREVRLGEVLVELPQRLAEDVGRLRGARVAIQHDGWAVDGEGRRVVAVLGQRVVQSAQDAGGRAGLAIHRLGHLRLHIVGKERRRQPFQPPAVLLLRHRLDQRPDVGDEGQISVFVELLGVRQVWVDAEDAARLRPRRHVDLQQVVLCQRYVRPDVAVHVVHVGCTALGVRHHEVVRVHPAGEEEVHDGLERPLRGLALGVIGQRTTKWSRVVQVAAVLVPSVVDVLQNLAIGRVKSPARKKEIQVVNDLGAVGADGRFVLQLSPVVVLGVDASAPQLPARRVEVVVVAKAAVAVEQAEPHQAQHAVQVADDVGRREQLRLRRHEVGAHHGTRRLVVGLVEVEHAGGSPNHLPDVAVQVAHGDLPRLLGIEVQRSHEVDQLHQGLAHLPVHRVQRYRGRQRLAIEQDGGEGGAEVSILAAADAVVGSHAEGIRHARHVSRRRVGGGEALDEEVGQEHRRVVVVEQVLQHRVGLVLSVAHGHFVLHEEGRRVVEAHAIAHVHRGRQVAEVAWFPRRRLYLEDAVLAEAVRPSLGVHGDAGGRALLACRGVALFISSGLVGIRRHRPDTKALQSLVDAGDGVEDGRRRHGRVAHAGVEVGDEVAVAATAALTGLRVLLVQPVRPEDVLRLLVQLASKPVAPECILNHMHRSHTTILRHLGLHLARQGGPDGRLPRAAVQGDAGPGTYGLVAIGFAARLRGIVADPLVVVVRAHAIGDGVTNVVAAGRAACKGTRIGADVSLSVAPGDGSSVLVERHFDAGLAPVLVVDPATAVEDEQHRADGVHVALVAVAREILRQLDDASEAAGAGAVVVTEGLVESGRVRVQRHAEHARFYEVAWRAVPEIDKLGALLEEGLRRELRAQGIPISDEGAVQTGLGEDVPIVGPNAHGVDVVDVVELLDVLTARLADEARPNAGKRQDVIVGVGSHSLSVRVEHRRAVGVQLPQADGKQLHDLSGVVLVREDPAPAVQLVLEGPRVHECEHGGHEWRVAHFPQHVEEVAEAVAHEDVVVGRIGLLEVLRAGALFVDHEDLRKRPCHALAQLIGGLERHVQPYVVLAVNRAVAEQGLVELLGTKFFYAVDGEGIVRAFHGQVPHLAWRTAGLFADAASVGDGRAD